MKLYPPLYQTSSGTPRDLPTLLNLLSQGFGENYDFYHSHFGTNGHSGLDWPCSTGTSIYASHDGVVESVSLDSTRGEGVVLRGADGITFYWHFQQPIVKVGDIIKRGQQLGLSDNTGLSTGPHLHFEYRPDSEPRTNGFYGAVDPTPFLVWSPLPQSTDVMSEKEVKALQALEGYFDPAGVQYWTGKLLSDYLAARLADKIKTIQQAQ